MVYSALRDAAVIEVRMPRAPSKYDDGRPARKHLIEKFLRGIRKLESGCWVCDASFQCGDNGYRQVMITIYGKKFRDYIHRLSFEHFKGPLPDGLDICHECDNPPCCNPEHLFSGTRTENLQDMVAKERNVHGENHHFAKLTEDIVLQMYSMSDEGMSQYQIGQKVGIHKRYAWLILSGNRWKHLYKRHRL